MWPQAIANDFKDIRVMVYGYDAGVAPRRNHITLLDYGRELAYRLRDHRRRDEVCIHPYDSFSLVLKLDRREDAPSSSLDTALED